MIAGNTSQYIWRWWQLNQFIPESLPIGCPWKICVKVGCGANSSPLEDRGSLNSFDQSMQIIVRWVLYPRNKRGKALACTNKSYHSSNGELVRWTTIEERFDTRIKIDQYSVEITEYFVFEGRCSVFGSIVISFGFCRCEEASERLLLLGLLFGRWFIGWAASFLWHYAIWKRTDKRRDGTATTGLRREGSGGAVGSEGHEERDTT